jgi:hypothetical protein
MLISSLSFESAKLIKPGQGPEIAMSCPRSGNTPCLCRPSEVKEPTTDEFYGWSCIAAGVTADFLALQPFEVCPRAVIDWLPQQVDCSPFIIGVSA